MPKVKFQATWTLDTHEQFTIPKGYILLKYEKPYRVKLGKELLKLDAWQTSRLQKLKESGNQFCIEKDVLRTLDVIIDYNYKKRTLDQNALMWALYEIEANEQNGGQSGAPGQIVTKDQLYYNDLILYGDREDVTTNIENMARHIQGYRIIEKVIYCGKEIKLDEFLKIKMYDENRVKFIAIPGSSTFTTKKMALWIDRIFNRLSYNGVSLDNSSSIADYWIKWRSSLNSEKVILHDEIMTQAEYKELNPICEACGHHILDGQAELSHIKSIGMGGDRKKEPKKNYTSNWLCLHATPCHREYWHGEGVERFKKRFQHLSYKIDSALNRDYKPIDTEPEQAELFKFFDYEKDCKDLDIF